MIELRVNGKKRAFQGPEFTRLIDVLRVDFGLTGTKEGCGEGECGACTVFLDGELVNSCLIPVYQADGSRVLPPLSVGEMTLRLYAALNYSQNSARDLRLEPKWSVSAFFAKGYVHITNSKQRKHR